MTATTRVIFKALRQAGLDVVSGFDPHSKPWWEGSHVGVIDGKVVNIFMHSILLDDGTGGKLGCLFNCHYHDLQELVMELTMEVLASVGADPVRSRSFGQIFINGYQAKMDR